MQTSTSDSLEAATYIERIKRGLQKGLSKLASWFSEHAPDDDDPVYDGPLCTKAEFIALHRRPSAKHQAIQRMRPFHWLHPKALILACVHERLQAAPCQPQRLKDVLRYHMGIIHLVGPYPAEVGWQKMPPITPYILSEEALIAASQGTLGDICPSACQATDVTTASTASKVAMQEVSEAAASLRCPETIGHLQADLSTHGQPTLELVDTFTGPGAQLQSMEQYSPCITGTKPAATKERQGSARAVTHITASAGCSPASPDHSISIPAGDGADTLCSLPIASQGQQVVDAELAAFFGVEPPHTAPQAEQLEVVCSAAPVAACPMLVASAALRAVPSPPLPARKSPRSRWASNLAEAVRGQDIALGESPDWSHVVSSSCPAWP